MLAIVSFIIGFFPIVGSWSVYVPVAAWLAVFRDAPGQALAMLVIGFLVNTVYISTFLRPKIAAERSKVLNFYWMLVALVTGVYTFGLVGILLGPDADRPAQGDPRHDHVAAGVGLVGSRIESRR